jgi:glutaredoxin-related protein
MVVPELGYPPGLCELLTVALSLYCHKSEVLQERELLRRIASTSAWSHCVCLCVEFGVIGGVLMVSQPHQEMSQLGVLSMGEVWMQTESAPIVNQTTIDHNTTLTEAHKRQGALALGAYRAPIRKSLT